MAQYKTLSNGYVVCSDGFVISTRGNILKPFKTSAAARQYYVVMGDKNYNLAKLVMDSFTFNVLDLDNVLHIDWDETRNELVNLKRCTRGDLLRHYKMGKKRGVNLYRTNKDGTKVYRAYVGGFGKSKTLGYFKSEEEAYAVFKKAYTEAYGFAPF